MRPRRLPAPARRRVTETRDSAEGDAGTFVADTDPWGQVLGTGSRLPRVSQGRWRKRWTDFFLLSRRSRCLGWRRLRAAVSTQRPPTSTVATVPRSARRAGGSHARVRRVRGDHSAGRSWSGANHLVAPIQRMVHHVLPELPGGPDDADPHCLLIVPAPVSLRPGRARLRRRRPALHAPRRRSAEATGASPAGTSSTRRAAASLRARALSG
jgi:hypothetical protein